MKVLFVLVVGSLILVGSYPYMESGRAPNDCLDCHEDLMNQPFLHAPMNDACNTCHEPTGNPHPQEGLTGFTLVAETPDLCYVCHEALNSMDLVHYPVQDGDCLGCHAIHGSPNPSLVKQATTATLCFQCHDLEIQNHSFLHLPVRQGMCQDCHNPHQSEYGALLKDSKPQLCFNCHDKAGSEYEISDRHQPFSEDCSTCHSSHGSSTEHLLVEDIPGLCYMCHDEIQEQIKMAKVQHRIVENKKTCLNCHTAHASDWAPLLQNDKTRLCLRCHDTKIQTGTGTFRNIAILLKEGQNIHGAMEFDGCSTCHSPHGSEYTSILKSRYPSGIYVEANSEQFALCFECHDMALLEDEKTETGTNFRDGIRNLHFVHMKGGKGRSCHLCHNNHGSPQKHLIEETIPYGNWAMQMQFSPTETGGSCLPGCHGKLEYHRNK